MSCFINDIVTYSSKGFEKLDIAFFLSKNNSAIENIDSDYLQGKGLRHIPKSVRIAYNVVAKMLDNEYYSSMRERMSLYYTNGVSSIEAQLDFERESLQYGSNKVNPAKAPFTINCSLAGWIALKEQLNNTVLSLSCGRCGIFSAFDLCELDFYDNKNSLAIVLGANFTGEAYEEYKLSSSFTERVSVAMLISPNKQVNSIIEILDTKIMRYEKIFIEKIIAEKCGHLFIEGDSNLDFCNIHNIFHINNTSTQLSYFPFLINNILSIKSINRGDICEYIIVDKGGLVGYAKLKVI